MSLQNHNLQSKVNGKADQNYALKYPLSSDLNTLQNYLVSAKAELDMLKKQAPTLSGDKRQRQRNITALSNRIMQLQNKTKDFNIGIAGDTSSLSIAPPEDAINPKIDSTATPLLGVDDDPTQFDTWKASQNSNVSANPPYSNPKTAFSDISTIVNDTIKKSLEKGSQYAGQGPLPQLKKKETPQQEDTTLKNKNQLPTVVKNQSNIGAYITIGAVVLGIGVITYLMFKKKK